MEGRLLPGEEDLDKARIFTRETRRTVVPAAFEVDQAHFFFPPLYVGVLKLENPPGEREGNLLVEDAAVAVFAVLNIDEFPRIGVALHRIGRHDEFRSVAVQEWSEGHGGAFSAFFVARFG